MGSLVIRTFTGVCSGMSAGAGSADAATRTLAGGKAALELELVPLLPPPWRAALAFGHAPFVEARLPMTTASNNTLH